MGELAVAAQDAVPPGVVLARHVVRPALVVRLCLGRVPVVDVHRERRHLHPREEHVREVAEVPLLALLLVVVEGAHLGTEERRLRLPLSTPVTVILIIIAVITTVVIISVIISVE